MKKFHTKYFCNRFHLTRNLRIFLTEICMTFSCVYNNKSVSKFSEGKIQFAIFQSMDDDLNSPMVISELFDCVRTINQIYDGKQTISAADLAELRRVVDLFVFDILGLRDDLAGDNSQMLSSVVDMILNIRMEAKNAKDWATSDKIRDGLAAIGIKVKDRKDGFDWEAE